MSDYSRPQSDEEIEDEKFLRKLEDTPVSIMIERGITLSELRTLLKDEFGSSLAIELARKRKFTYKSGVRRV
jgi:hypothetical protein